MFRSCRVATLVLVSTLYTGLCSGYYHFLHFPVRNGSGIPEKFDLNSLRNKTLSYFISDQGSVQFSANDSYPGLVSQVRLAAKAWNDVETSDLRLAFGGIASPAISSASPSLEVTFDEVPPGLIAAGAPIVRGGANASFVPI